jgi:2-methylcitrate dehydratase PrpD
MNIKESFMKKKSYQRKSEVSRKNFIKNSANVSLLALMPGIEYPFHRTGAKFTYMNSWPKFKDNSTSFQKAKDKTSSFCWQLAAFSYKCEISELAPPVINKAKLAVIDYISALCAGAKYGEISPLIRDFARKVGGIKESSIIGDRQRCPAVIAAMANSTISHSAELDDGHRFGTSHPAVTIIPTAISLAERTKCTGKELLVAIIVGYDVMLRIATAINPGHWSRGFHSTGTCGAIGASATAAKILRLDRTKTMHAISMGALQSAGLQEMLYSNPMIKPLQAGKAALAGVVSGELARSSARSPSTVFEGPLGFFNAMTDEVDYNCLRDKLGERFEIERTYFKFYPTCRHVHCSIDLVRKILNENPFSADMVESVKVRTYTIAAKEVGSSAYPQNSDEAMFSIPYAVSVWLHENRFTPDELGRQFLARQDIKKTARKVTIKADKHWDAKYPEARGATVIIQLKDGRVFEESRELPYGEPENLDNDIRLVKKYEDYTDGVLSRKDAQKLLDYVQHLELKKNIILIAETLSNADV